MAEASGVEASRIMQRCDALALQFELTGGLTRALPGGAGHDGTAMKAIADVATLFVRCKGVGSFIENFRAVPA